jgi:hypothetical protein
MPALKRKMCPPIVIEHGGHPALRIMAIRARGLAGFRKLARVGVLVAILTNLRRALELHRFLTGWHFVTRGTIYGAMCTQQRELRL